MWYFVYVKVHKWWNRESCHKQLWMNKVQRMKAASKFNQLRQIFLFCSLAVNDLFFLSADSISSDSTRFLKHMGT